MPLLWLLATELAKSKPESWVSHLVLGFTMSARQAGASSCSCVSALPVLAPYPPHSPTPVSLPACVASMTAGDLVSGVGHPICLCPGSLSWGLSLDKEHEAVAPWGSEGHSLGRAETQGALTHLPSQPCSHRTGELSDTFQIYHTQVPGHALRENTPTR